MSIFSVGFLYQITGLSKTSIPKYHCTNDMKEMRPVNKYLSRSRQVLLSSDQSSADPVGRPGDSRGVAGIGKIGHRKMENGDSEQ